MKERHDFLVKDLILRHKTNFYLFGLEKSINILKILYNSQVERTTMQLNDLESDIVNYEFLIQELEEKMIKEGSIVI